MARVRSSERGAALLVVMVAVAVLTALAVELAYDTRVSLRIAANARDDLKASYAARGGLALSRVVLSFQQDVDRALSGLPAQAGFPVPRPQLWRVVPVGTSLADGLFGGPGATRAPMDAGEGRPPDGFEVAIDDEGRKVNVQLDALSGLLATQVQALYQLVCDPRWDALFDREDEHGIRVSRQDLLVHLRDWVDDNEEGSALAASFPPGACLMIPAPNPFERGFQDENFPYDRGPDRYRAKNARMDSLAELHMVAGIGDDFMAAFGDAVTVYLPRDAQQRNVNQTDPDALLANARMIAQPQDHPMLQDPEFPARLHTFVMERTFGGMVAMSPQDFGQLVEAAGVTVDRNRLAPTSTSNPFTDRSLVFRIRALGRAGDVTKTIDAVVQFPKPAATAQPAAGTPAAGAAAAARAAQAAQAQAQAALATTPGKLVHWREE